MYMDCISTLFRSADIAYKHLSPFLYGRTIKRRLRCWLHGTLRLVFTREEGRAGEDVRKEEGGGKEAACQREREGWRRMQILGYNSNRKGEDGM